MSALPTNITAYACPDSLANSANLKSTYVAPGHVQMVGPVTIHPEGLGVTVPEDIQANVVKPELTSVYQAHVGREHAALQPLAICASANQDGPVEIVKTKSRNHQNPVDMTARITTLAP